MTFTYDLAAPLAAIGNLWREGLNSEQSDGQTPETEKHFGLKIVISLSVLVASWIMWFVFARGWIVALGLSIAACISAEYLGAKLFAKRSGSNATLPAGQASVKIAERRFVAD